MIPGTEDKRLGFGCKIVKCGCDLMKPWSWFFCQFCSWCSKIVCAKPTRDDAGDERQLLTDRVELLTGRVAPCLSMSIGRQSVHVQAGYDVRDELRKT